MKSRNMNIWVGLTLVALLGVSLSTIATAERVPRPLAPLPNAGPVPGPPDNPNTPAKIKLGELMFFETRLSGDGSTPCVKCHEPKMGWGTSDDLSPGYPGTLHFRNSHTVLNSAYLKKLFWDGRALSLESQFWGAAGGESAGNMSKIMGEARLRQIPVYRKMFMEVFGELPTWENMARAGAAFQRTLVSDPKNVPFDRYMNGDKTAMSPEAIKGMALFEGKAGCIQCHDGMMFTDEDFHSFGSFKSKALDWPARNPRFEEDAKQQVEMRYRAKVWGIRNYTQVDQDLGVYFQTHRKEDRFKWRTQPLRELKYQAPYFHNGYAFTLDEVVEFYNQGGGDDDPYGTKSPLIRKLNLTADEKGALVAFLEALSSDKPPFADIRPLLPKYDPPQLAEAKKK